MRQVAAKIAQAIMLILAVIILNFFLIQIAPGDVVDALAGGPDGAGEASAEVNERLRETSSTTTARSATSASTSATLHEVISASRSSLTDR